MASERKRTIRDATLSRPAKGLHKARTNEWQYWFNRGRAMLPVREGNRVAALVDGVESFADMYDAMVTATNRNHYIYILNWWLDLDVRLLSHEGTDRVRRLTGDDGQKDITLRNVLLKAAERGVQIRVMLWNQWGPKNSKEVSEINKWVNSGAILDNNTLNFGSHHQKILIVKGATGLISYCGGIDFNKDRLLSENSKEIEGPIDFLDSLGLSSGHGFPLHDVHCGITGPAAFDLLKIFTERWEDHPDSVDINRNKGRLRGLSERRPRKTGQTYVQIGRTYGNGSDHGGIRNRFGGHYYSFAPKGERTAERMIFHAIGKAREFIYMEEQYLISMDASDILRRALPSIKHLIILLTHSNLTGVPGIWTRRKAFIDNLRSSEHGKKVIICYRKAPGSIPDPKKIDKRLRHTYVHSKMFVFDDEYAIIGSANCNNRGYNHDSEVMAGIFEPRQGRAAQNRFAKQLRMRLWAEHLNLTVEQVRNPMTCINRWKDPSIESSIGTYDENAVNDIDIIPDIFVDPYGG
jgi:phosphatidylserine/phosphatidylglycerophosphate/cardiolipin synthase-like enzyme